jgi:hypothetical protein
MKTLLVMAFRRQVPIETVSSLVLGLRGTVEIVIGEGDFRQY